MNFKNYTNINGVAVDSLILTFVRIITFSTNIIITMILSRFLSMEEYGTFSQGNLIISVATSFLVLGLTDGVNYFYNKNKELSTKENYVNTIIGMQLILGVIGALIILIFQENIVLYFNNPNLANIIIYISIRPYLANSIALFQVLYVSNGKAKIIAIRNLVISIGQILVVIGVLLFTKSILILFVSLLVLDICQLLFFIIYFNKNYFKIRPWKIKFVYIKPILQYSIPMAVYVVISNFSREMDKLLIGNKTTVETLALYSNVSKQLPFDMIMISFSTVLIPFITKYVANNQFNKAKHLYSNYVQFGYITTWTLAAGAIISAPELIKFLYSDSYILGKDIFIVYLFVSMIRFANFGIILTAAGKTKSLLGYSIITLILNYILNNLLFNILGIIGPAIATLLSLLIVNTIILVNSSKIIGIKFMELLRIKEMIILVFQLISVSFLIILIKKLILVDSINYFFRLVITYGLFITIIFSI
ncbi:oligosaccharide flippase family protein, partial [Clostridium perfringens]|nr:oligosaccharide flippase family protein [Clostridium perfringens]